MKKTVCVILSVMMAFLCVCADVRAEGSTVTFSSSSNKAAPGDSITVTVGSDAIKGAYAVSVKVSFDPAVFETVSVNWSTQVATGPCSSEEDANRNGFFAGNFLDMKNLGELNIPDHTVYVTAVLKVRDNAPSGTSSIELTDFSAADEMSQALQTNINTESLNIQINSSNAPKSSAASSAGASQTPQSTSGSTISSGRSSSAPAGTANPYVENGSSAASGSTVSVTYYGCNGEVVRKMQVTDGTTLNETVLGYQFSQGIIASGLSMDIMPKNCTSDGYLVVDTGAGTQETGKQD
jgi:hypothetical protein